MFRAADQAIRADDDVLLADQRTECGTTFAHHDAFVGDHATGDIHVVANPQKIMRLDAAGNAAAGIHAAGPADHEIAVTRNIFGNRGIAIEYKALRDMRPRNRVRDHRAADAVAEYHGGRAAAHE